MSPSPSPAERVQAIYTAFSQGDVPGVLEHLSPEIDWEYGQAPNEVPWLQPRRGRDGVVGFFQALAGGLELTRFVPHTMLSGDNVVVALIDIEGRARGTGTRITETDEMHLWRFGADGRVTAFRHGLDTLQHARAHGSA